MTQQGDIRLFQTIDDGEIDVENGLISMDGGLETAAYLALFGGNDDDDASDSTKSLQYWGNLIETDPVKQHRSRTQFLLRTLPVTISNMKLVKAAAEADLNFFLTERIASSVDVSVYLPALNTVKLSIAIDAFGDRSDFEFTENWEASLPTPEVGAIEPPSANNFKYVYSDLGVAFIAPASLGDWVWGSLLAPVSDSFDGLQRSSSIFEGPFWSNRWTDNSFNGGTISVSAGKTTHTTSSSGATNAGQTINSFGGFGSAWTVTSHGKVLSWGTSVGVEPRWSRLHINVGADTFIIGRYQDSSFDGWRSDDEAGVVDTTSDPGQNEFWLRLRSDGVDVYAEYSTNGTSYTVLTTFAGQAGVPDYMRVQTTNNNATSATSMEYYEVTAVDGLGNDILLSDRIWLRTNFSGMTSDAVTALQPSDTIVDPIATSFATMLDIPASDDFSATYPNSGYFGSVPWDKRWIDTDGLSSISGVGLNHSVSPGDDQVNDSIGYNAVGSGDFELEVKHEIAGQDFDSQAQIVAAFGSVQAQAGIYQSQWFVRETPAAHLFQGANSGTSTLTISRSGTTVSMSINGLVKDTFTNSNELTRVFIGSFANGTSTFSDIWVDFILKDAIGGNDIPLIFDGAAV